MKASELKLKLIKEYKKSLDKNSKWFNSDLENYKEGLKGKSSKDLQRMLDNIICLNGGNKEFNKKIVREINKLEKAGMFDVSSLSPRSY